MQRSTTSDFRWLHTPNGLLPTVRNPLDAVSYRHDHFGSPELTVELTWRLRNLTEYFADVASDDSLLPTSPFNRIQSWQNPAGLGK